MAYQQVLRPFDSLGEISASQPAAAPLSPSDRLPSSQADPLPALAGQTGETHLSLSVKFLGWFLVVPGVTVFLLNWLCIQLGW